MNKIFLIVLILLTAVSCSSVSKNSKQNEAEKSVDEDMLNRAESNASIAGRRLLETSRSIISNQEIIVGGCWDFINAVFDRAGIPTNKRVTVFKSKIQGPYVKNESLQAGDWLYYINHAYRDIEHSAIFVAWINEEKKVALMVSYVGENQKKPATYKQYVLNNIYNIIRPKD